MITDLLSERDGSLKKLPYRVGRGVLFEDAVCLDLSAKHGKARLVSADALVGVHVDASDIHLHSALHR